MKWPDRLLMVLLFIVGLVLLYRLPQATLGYAEDHEVADIERAPMCTPVLRRGWSGAL